MRPGLQGAGIPPAGQEADLSDTDAMEQFNWILTSSLFFVYNQKFTRQLRVVQQQYRESAQLPDPPFFGRRPFFARLKENCAPLAGPLL